MKPIRRREFLTGVAALAALAAYASLDPAEAMQGSRRAIFGGGGRFLTGDAFINFATMGNGVPTVAATGQPIGRGAVSTGIVQATVSNGALVAGDSGQASSAAYTFLRLPEEIKSFYADVSFSDANDSATLIAAGNVTSIGNTAIHIIATNSSWAAQYYSSAVPTTVQSGTFPAVAPGQRCRIGWRIDGSNFYILMANGVEIGPVASSSALTSRSNYCAIFEHFRNAPGPLGVKFYGVAVNMHANPIAAGRTNLLLNQNNVGAVTWTRNLSGPISGQPDASGGTLGEQLMEVAVSQQQFFYQPITKAASPLRYTQRYKAKLIGRSELYLQGLDGVGGSLLQYLNLPAGTYDTIGGTFTEANALIYSFGNGWYEVKQDFISSADVTLYTALGTALADNNGTFVGDPTKGMVVYDEWLYPRPT